MVGGMPGSCLSGELLVSISIAAMLLNALSFPFFSAGRSCDCCCCCCLVRTYVLRCPGVGCRRPPSSRVDVIVSPMRVSVY